MIRHIFDAFMRVHVAAWERSVIDSLDAQRIRDLAARDEIRAWLVRDGWRGEALPLP